MPYNRRGQYPTAILYNLPANQLNIPHLKKNGAARRLLRSAFIFAFFSERYILESDLCAVPLLFFETQKQASPQGEDLIRNGTQAAFYGGFIYIADTDDIGFYWCT